MDLEALVTDELREEISGLRARVLRRRGLLAAPAARARVDRRCPMAARASGSFTGDGPIDAVFQAINAATGKAPALSEFTIGAVTEGQDALGEVSVVVELDGFTGAGQGVSTDIIDAAARAYVRALSVAVARAQAGEAIGLPEPAGPEAMVAALTRPAPPDGFGWRRLGWVMARGGRGVTPGARRREPDGVARRTDMRWRAASGEEVGDRDVPAGHRVAEVERALGVGLDIAARSVDGRQSTYGDRARAPRSRQPRASSAPSRAA